MKVVQFYRSFLESTGLVYDEQNNCFYTKGARVGQPVQVDGLVLSLPTTEATKQYNEQADKIMIYHPVHENALNRDSQTLIFTQKLIRISLGTDYLNLAECLLKLAADVERHESLTPDQREIISQFVNADEKMVKLFEQVANKTDPNKPQKALDIILQRGDTTSGASRIAKIKWNLLEDLLASSDHIYGVKIRKKDVSTIEKLHEILFSFRSSKLTDVSPSMQMVTTNELVAPSFRVLLELYREVKSMFISLHQVFEDIFLPLNSVDMMWVEGLTKLKSFRTLIPAFPGNEGGEPIRAKEMPSSFNTPKAAASTPVAPAPAAPTYTPSTPVQNPVPTVDTSAVNRSLDPKEHKSFMDYVNAARAQSQQPYYAAPQYGYRGQPVQQSPQIDYSMVGGQGYQPNPPAPSYAPTYGNSNQYQQRPVYGVPSYGYGRTSKHGNMK